MWSGISESNFVLLTMLNNTMKHAICQHCHSSFIIGQGSLGKFCSLSCGTSYRNKANLENTIIKYELSPIKCNGCTQTLTFKQRKNKYCSNSCASKKNQTPRKRGPTAAEKFPFSKIKFILCSHTNQYYINRNPDGSMRKSSPYIKTIKEQYYSAARFKINVYHYPAEFDLVLLEKHGWYTCPGLKRKGQPKNISGVSRDHIISVSYGFANNIDPAIISHPANCRLMLHSDNKIKHSKCSLTVDQLLEKIDIWDKKYTERRNGLEPLTSNVEG